MALFATGDRDSESVRRGVEYLLSLQAIRRLLEGRALDRDRLPEGLLPSLPPLRDVFPALGALALRARRSDRRDSPGRAGSGECPGRAPHRSRSELMRFPVHMMTDNIQHQVRNAIKGNKRYPFVLMLEPLYTCNLACIGCAIERHTGQAQGPAAAREVHRGRRASRRRPVVSICGGEPTIYPELPQLVDEIIKRKRQIILCTNGLLLDENLYGMIPPNKRLTINVHLDGMKRDPRLRLRARGRLRQGDRHDRRGRQARPPHDGQHDDLQGDLDGRGRGALQAPDGHGRRGHARLARATSTSRSTATSSCRARRCRRSSAACSTSRRSTS